MSHLFDSALQQYFEESSEPPVFSAAPFTVSHWQRSPDNSINSAGWWVGNKNAAGDYWASRLSDLGDGQGLRFRIVQNQSSLNVDTVATWTVDQWHHICCVEAAANDHRVFLDGANKVTSGTSKAPQGSINRISVGRFGDNSPTNYAEGNIAHVAIWNVALSDGEVATLATGHSPLRVRRGNLIFYAPLNGFATTELDIIGRRNLTNFNGQAKDFEPPISQCIKEGVA